MADFFGSMGGVFGGVLSSLKYVLYLSPVAVLILILTIHFRNKLIYKYPVRIFNPLAAIMVIAIILRTLSQ